MPNRPNLFTAIAADQEAKREHAEANPNPVAVDLEEHLRTQREAFERHANRRSRA